MVLFWWFWGFSLVLLLQVIKVSLMLFENNYRKFREITLNYV